MVVLYYPDNVTMSTGNGMKKHCSLSAVTVDGVTYVSNNAVNLKP